MKAGSFRVREGNRVLTVSRHAKGWRFGYRTAGGWKYVTRRKRVEIEEAARQVLEEMATGFVWSALPVAHRAWLERLADLTADEDARRAVDDFLSSRERSVGLAVAVERWLGKKCAKAGEETPHLAQVRRKVRELADGFPGKKVADIDFETLRGWLVERTAGLTSTTWEHWRMVLVEFWEWAKREGYVTASVATPAERLESRLREKQERRVVTRAELLALLREVRPEFRAWIVLGAWCGLRPEEIVPGARKKANRRGLRCEDIDWQFNVIRLPAEASKVAYPRMIPLCPAARAGLLWAGIEPGSTGAVLLRNPARKAGKEAETIRLGRIVFGGEWPQDILRHSYGSYRNAIVRDLGRVAEEMGTSVKMLHAHYHNPRAMEEGDEFFTVPTSSDGIDFLPVSEHANRSRKQRKA